MSNQKYLKSIATHSISQFDAAVENGALRAEPFSYLVVDNFLPEAVAKSAMDAFPPMDDPSWEKTSNEGIEVKNRSDWKSEFDIPDGIIEVVRLMNSVDMLQAISKALDIPKLIPDPYFSGGGLNVTERSGMLDVHVDGNYHDATGLNRRVNALVYLNPNWQEDWGGEFGVYANDMETVVEAVAPLFNRLVVFDTHDRSYHGLPNPINFPQDDPRRSIILYYYTVAPRLTEQIVVAEPHSALWRSKGLRDKRGNKTRDYS